MSSNYLNYLKFGIGDIFWPHITPWSVSGHFDFFIVATEDYSPQTLVGILYNYVDFKMFFFFFICLLPTQNI